MSAEKHQNREESSLLKPNNVHDEELMIPHKIGILNTIIGFTLVIYFQYY